MLCFLSHQCLGCVECFLADDRFVAAFCVIFVQLASVFYLGEGQSFGFIGFLEESVSHIFFVGQDIGDGYIVPMIVTVLLGDTTASQISDDFRDGASVQVG